MKIMSILAFVTDWGMRKLITILTLCALSLGAGAQNLTIRHLSGTHTMIRWASPICSIL